MDKKLLTEDMLRDIVRKALIEEQVPHSLTVISEKESLISVDAVLPDWGITKDISRLVSMKNYSAKPWTNPVTQCTELTSVSMKDAKHSDMDICDFPKQISTNIAKSGEYVNSRTQNVNTDISNDLTTKAVHIDVEMSPEDNSINSPKLESCNRTESHQELANEKSDKTNIDLSKGHEAQSLSPSEFREHSKSGKVPDISSAAKSNSNGYCLGRQFSPEEIKELEQIIAVLVRANDVFCEFPRQNEPAKDILLQKQDNYLKQKTANECSPCENEAEKRERIRCRVLEVSVRYIERRIIESVKFAKKIPGFQQLPMEDQANLIRESRTESGIIGGMRGINTDKQVFSSMQGDFFSLEDMKQVFDEDLLKGKILLSEKIAKLHMSLEEEALLRAVTITATDRCFLHRKDLVEAIQNKLLNCLTYCISKNGKHPVGTRLGRLFDVLVSCREVTEVDIKEVKKIFLEWPSFSSYKLAEEFL